MKINGDNCTMCDPEPCICNDMFAPDGPRCHCGSHSYFPSGECSDCGMESGAGCDACRPARTER